MIQIKKTILTLVALLAVTTGAWADNAVPYTVGATDNSGAYRSQNSNTLAIKDGQVATFEFTNYTYGAQLYHNWICEIDNAADQDQALIRADLWENVANSRDNFTYSNYLDMILNNDAATFMDKMQGAKVRLQAIYYQGKITIEATMTPTAGDPLVMVYEKAYTETQAKILLTIERCHLDITKEEIRTIVPLTRGTGEKINEWTLTNGMPAGNVTVSVNYFPQAAFAMSTDATPVALAPKASTSARANTDDPLIEGGTVAGIVDGEALLEEGQGTLLYHFSATQLDAVALEALTATDWTDKVPTADGLAEGTVYVYYYIKGADELPGINPGAKFTFSDSDIQELAVTVLPEPTYTVEFAEGTPESGKWTASPNAAKKGQQVTVTYEGPRKVMGVKAEKTAAAATDLSPINANYTASDGETLTGTLPSNVKISIADGATVTLDGVTINGTNNYDYSWAGITCEGDATIILSGTNTVKGFYEDYPGIQAAAGKTLTINGTGSLTASTYGWSAGIGGGKGIACGNIEIQDGTITATGGQFGAGIGGGNNASCGNITISGGTVTATGGERGAGIGGGRRAIDDVSCGNILISGGTVTATGGESAAGIGGGRGNNNKYLSNCGTITITTGVTKVTATKGEYAPNSIGAGEYGTCGTVTIGGNTGAISESPYTYQPSN